MTAPISFNSREIEATKNGLRGDLSKNYDLALSRAKEGLRFPRNKEEAGTELYAAVSRAVVITIKTEVLISIARELIGSWSENVRPSNDEVASILSFKIKSLQVDNKINQFSFKWFSETVERRPNWIWTHYLLRGATSIVGGKQGASKGLFTVDIAARLTRGDKMPDSSPIAGPGRVLFVTREDSPEMALMPRLRMAGADLSRVAWSYGEFTNGTTIGTMSECVNAMEKMIIEYGIDLVVIDPLGSWVEDDMNNGQRIRAVLDPVNRLARKADCAILFVAHLRKSLADDPMDSFSGSAQVTAAVRTALLISSVGNSDDRILEVVKTNFKKPRNPLVYTLNYHDLETDDPPYLLWRQASQLDVEALSATRSGLAPLIPIEEVLPLLRMDHCSLESIVRDVHKKISFKLKGATLQGVRNAIDDIIQTGRAFEGRTKHNGRTVGLSLQPEIETITDRAIAFISRNPESTNAQVAKACGCSTTQVDRARKSVRINSPEVKIAKSTHGKNFRIAKET